MLITKLTKFSPPTDHDERERKRNSLQRQNSEAGAILTSASSVRKRQDSGHKRTGSLAFKFRGHSRQASRTDSIYTIRDKTNIKKGIVYTLCKDIP